MADSTSKTRPLFTPLTRERIATAMHRLGDPDIHVTADGLSFFDNDTGGTPPDALILSMLIGRAIGQHNLSGRLEGLFEEIFPGEG